MVAVNVPGSMESVVEPPAEPSITLPPFLGVAASAFVLNNAGAEFAVLLDSVRHEYDAVYDALVEFRKVIAGRHERLAGQVHGRHAR